MNRLGILAIQHSVVNTTTNEPCFVDFILAPAVEDADDEYASSSQVDVSKAQNALRAAQTRHSRARANEAQAALNSKRL